MSVRGNIGAEGLDRLIRVLEAGGDAARRELPNALHDEVQEIFAVTQRRVPVRTGALRGSGHVTRHGMGADTSFIIGYGGSAAPYAIYVHEDPDARHDPPTGAKFVEGPIMEAREGMGMRLARRVLGRMGVR